MTFFQKLCNEELLDEECEYNNEEILYKIRL